MRLLERVLAAFPADQGPAAAAPVAETDALQLLRAQGLPEPRDEHWQHANLNALGRVTRLLCAAPAEAAELVAARCPAPLPGFQRIVTLNGRLLAPLSIPGTGAAAHGAPVRDADLRFGLLARLFGTGAISLSLTGRHSLEWLNICDARYGSAYPRLHLNLADGAHVRLVERLIGAADQDAMICSDLDFRLGATAELTHTRLHAPANSSLLLDTVAVTAATRAKYCVEHIAAGRAQARCSYVVNLDGPGSELHWNGVAAVTTGDGFDALVRVNHRGRDTRTVQRFRGICVGNARLGCDADVRVGSTAAGASVTQNLRALNDGAGTHVSLRPRLTIETDEIQASHGATTGQLDDDLLFYLLSRGIDPATARSLLKWAFLQDVLAGIDVPALRHDAEQLLAAQLTEVVALDLQS